MQSTGFGASDGKSGLIKDIAHKLLMIQAVQLLSCRVVKFTGAKRGTQGGLPSIIEACKVRL